MADIPALQRHPYGQPSHPDKGRNLPPTIPKINFRHPGYDDADNIFLMLPGLDHPDGGIHHQTARNFCAIIFNNRYTGFFTEDSAGARRVETPEDGILQAKNYYFRVTDNPTDKYPMVRSFRDWRFPHGSLPSYWTSCHIPNAPVGRLLPRQSTLTEAILARDLTCRLTNHVESTEHAHLVPRNEQAWFDDNAMFQYTNLSRVDIDGIDDSVNGILLRSDVHTLFDQRRFALVPKPSFDATDKLSLAAHVLIPGVSSQMIQLYHNVPTQELTGVAVEFLFARLAWTIFPFAKGFLQTGQKRVLCVREDGKSVTREYSSEECKLFTTKSKSRSASPKKRKPETSENAEEEATPATLRRGRKRRRTSSLTDSSHSDGSWCTSENFDTDPSEVGSSFRKHITEKETEIMHTDQKLSKA